MPAYQYNTKKKGTMWYAKVNYTENGVHKQHIKRGFKTKEDAELYEEAFLLQHPRIHSQPMSAMLQSILEVYATSDAIRQVESKSILKNTYNPQQLFAESMRDYTGVYIVHNISKNIYYIGQGKSVIRRLKAHFSGVGGNGDVYADYKYGDKFEFCISPFNANIWSTLDEQERYYIQKFNANVTGYNRTKGNV